MFEINQLNCCHYLSLQAHKLYHSDVYHSSVITQRCDEVHSQPSMRFFSDQKQDNMHGSRGCSIFIMTVFRSCCCCGDTTGACHRFSSSSLSASILANGRYLLRNSTRSYRYDKWGTDADKTASRKTTQTPKITQKSRNTQRQ